MKETTESIEKIRKANADETPTAKSGLEKLADDIHLLVLVFQFLGYNHFLGCVNKKISKISIHPSVWELYAKVPPHGSILSIAFRRAANYAYREMDEPSPNVNRRGASLSVRACLLNDKTTVKEYISVIKKLCREKTVLSKPPVHLTIEQSKSSRLTKKYNPEMPSFNDVRLLPHDPIIIDESVLKQYGSHMISGGIDNGLAKFWLWSLEEHNLKASISHSSPTCYSICESGLAIGSSDGSIKVWDFSPYRQNWKPLHDAADLPPTVHLSPRSGITLANILKLKSNCVLTKVEFDSSENNCMKQIGAANEKGEILVWDVSHGDLKLTLAADRIHRSTLPRTFAFSNPTVTSLLIYRNTVICGTSAGLVRVFDSRSGKLTHRLSGHPSSVSSTKTRGRILWSSGSDGSVRWWGGKSAKIMKKSPICSGSVSDIQLNDAIIVAGYSEKGMEAWDLRTQTPVCTFSSFEHGGIKSLQFDNSKIVTVSSTGKAALWRWYQCNPEFYFPNKLNDKAILYSSAHFDPYGLVLGTKESKGFIYKWDKND